MEIFKRTVKPGNLNNALIASKFYSKPVKIGSILNVPENYVARIYSHSHFIIEFPQGKNVLDGEWATKLAGKTKNGPNKKFCFDLYFINILPTSLNFSKPCYLKTNGKLKKYEMQIDLKFMVSQNREIFCRNIINEFVSISGDSSKDYLKEVCFELILKLCKKLNITNFDLIDDDFISKLNVMLNVYGITILTIKLNIEDFVKGKKSKDNINTAEIEENLTSEQPSTITQSELDKVRIAEILELQKINEQLKTLNANQHNNNIKSLNENKYKYCPSCENIVIPNARFCSRCGYEFKQKELFNEIQEDR